MINFTLPKKGDTIYVPSSFYLSIVELRAMICKNKDCRRNLGRSKIPENGPVIRTCPYCSFVNKRYYRKRKKE